MKSLRQFELALNAAEMRQKRLWRAGGESNAGESSLATKQEDGSSRLTVGLQVADIFAANLFDESLPLLPAGNGRCVGLLACPSNIELRG